MAVENERINLFFFAKENNIVSRLLELSLMEIIHLRDERVFVSAVLNIPTGLLIYIFETFNVFQWFTYRL